METVLRLSGMVTEREPALNVSLPGGSEGKALEGAFTLLRGFTRLERLALST